MTDLQASATRIRDAASFLKNLATMQPRFENMDGIESGVGEGTITISIRVAQALFGGPWSSAGAPSSAGAKQDLNILSRRLLEGCQQALEPFRQRAEQLIAEEAANILASVPKLSGETQGKLQKNSPPDLQNIADDS